MNEDSGNIHPIVKKLLVGDRMTKWLKAEVLEARPGFCKLQMTAREEMANGFGIIHGSITFALADSAIAFASNAHGRHALSLNISIRHLSSVHVGDMITAEATVTKLKHRVANVDAIIHNQDGIRVADVQSTGYRKKEEW